MTTPDIQREDLARTARASLRRLRPVRSSRSGAATVIAAFTVVLMLGFTAAMLSMAMGSTAERNAAGAQIRAFTAANSGLAEAIASVRMGADLDGAMTGGVAANGEANDGLRLNNSWYWTWYVDNGDGTFSITATGGAGGANERVEATVTVTEPSSIYDNAIFAGNSSGDGAYSLDLGGTGKQADEIGGDIYSGGDVAVSGDATVSGMPRAAGTVFGATGESGVKQPIVDLASMNYAATADFDVGSLFGSASYESDDAGGKAWQLPEESPGHIFRMNPSNRTSETSGTVKDDYFLEDPYEKVRSDPNENGKDAYKVTLSGTNNKPGVDGNGAVYYIDGNLWVHNKSSYSLKIHNPSASGLQVTFVVKGNIYLADNLFTTNKNKDGIALIAMKDDKVADSGNIYFGDPAFGTLKQMSAFMYAENNFYDFNLDEKGSETVSVYGNMSAGNQVLIQRDYGLQHTKLTVEFDDRISEGELELPGLPGVSSTVTGGNTVDVLSWRRVPLTASESISPKGQSGKTVGGGN